MSFSLFQWLCVFGGHAVTSFVFILNLLGTLVPGHFLQSGFEEEKTQRLDFLSLLMRHFWGLCCVLFMFFLIKIRVRTLYSQRISLGEAKKGSQRKTFTFDGHV